MAASSRARVRLSEASQAFLNDDADARASGEYSAEDSTSEKVIDLLNQAQLEKENKLNCLKQVQEFIVNKDPTLLDNFLDEILVFQQDRSADVRKFVVGFIEEACKKDIELLSKVLNNLGFMLNDDNVAVQKRVMLCFTQLYKYALQYICKQKAISEELERMWELLIQIKEQIIDMLESDNDGIRTHAIKFMEMLVLVQSLKTQDSESLKKGEADISLEIVPRNHPLIKMTELREEGGSTLESLLTLIASHTISSVNLMASLGSLSAIARQRPAFMSIVVQAFESLHANLPTSLSKSQVSSVRKNLKLHLMSLMKHPSSIEFLPQITTLLTDLGASQAELQRNMPKASAEKRRSEPEAATSKKPKLDTEEIETMSASDAVDMTAQDIIPRLNKDTVTDLVLVSMLALPDSIPSHFHDTYTPIAAAGGQAQVVHLARLLATQMNAAKIGKGYERMEALRKAQNDPRMKEESMSIPVIGGPGFNGPGAEDDPMFMFGVPKPEEDSALQRMLGGHLEATKEKRPMDIKKTPFVPKEPAVPQLRMRKIKPFKLSDVTRELNPDERQSLMTNAVSRILASEGSAARSGVTQERINLIVGLVTQLGGDLKMVLQEFIQEEIRSRYDLLMSWLYQEYASSEIEGIDEDSDLRQSYSDCLLNLMDGLYAKLDPKDKLFTRILLDIPALTDGAVMAVRMYCEDLDRLQVGFSTLRELILKRPATQEQLLQTLLELTTNEKEQVRVQAIHSAKKLHTRPELAESIEKYALTSLQQLLADHPPAPEGLDPDIEVAPGEWTDDTIKLCLYLYLALLPQNHKLFHELAKVYTASSQIIKRIILRHLEHPVRAIGMASPELLQLVENCPTGAETLIARILNIITDKAVPTDELVKRVKELYHKRVSDVRFLIPVLTGLKKQEIIAVLPKLIKQSPSVVKEVFNRLLGCFHSDSKVSATSPLSPSELLVALHQIEAKSDMKSVMKASSLCFAEKTIYTQEVLAVVLHQLMEMNPLPTLFMRTVIQSLSICPRLVGFVMNILAKLITKQVWKQPKVWQGFVKCCQMTKPQSFSVLLQLPSRQLESVFEICPELKENLVLHVQSFTPHQRAHIPRSLLQILEKDGKKDEKKPKPEKPDKEQIDPEEEEEEEEEEDSTKGDKSPKRTRSHIREALKDKRKSRRSRSRSRSPRKKREKSAGEESASEGEIN
ncbi:symplekin [Pocillopora verrucosa]|uniref:symplekin n=1 Tax=Pocillopora verrucosa TaxID=203993 RepID=UPI0027976BF8|nr:symplekin-like [Pocillopora verrucosa]